MRKVWFPHLRSWLLAVRLAIPAYVGATVVLAFEFWRFGVLGGIVLIAGEGSRLFLTISIGALLVSLIWFLLQAGVYALFSKLLWSKPPQGLRLPPFMPLVVKHFGILVLSLLPIIVIFTIYILFVTTVKQAVSDLEANPLSLRRLSYDRFLLRYFWLWFISAAYLYEWTTPKNSSKSRNGKESQKEHSRSGVP